MVLVTEEARERRRRESQRRGAVCGLVIVLMIASIFVPTIGVQAADGVVGRGMFGASKLFLFADVTSGGFGTDLDVPTAAAGVNLAYYGLSLQHVGLVLGFFSVWALATESVGRWTRRGLLIAGWLFALSAPVIMTGYRLLEGGGIPAYLGWAWVLNLVIGVIMIIGARAAKARLDSTWYWARPEWNG
jgi:hypothetical protein